MVTGRNYHVEVFDFGELYTEWNKHFDFGDFELALAYCKKLNFQGKEFSLHAWNKYDDWNEDEKESLL